MKEIVVNSQSSFDRRLEEITRDFKAENPNVCFEWGFTAASNVTRYPSRYPNGVNLMLKMICPYCLELQLYDQKIWRVREGVLKILPNFEYACRVRKMKEENPGICLECINKQFEAERPNVHFQKSQAEPLIVRIGGLIIIILIAWAMIDWLKSR